MANKERCTAELLPVEIWHHIYKYLPYKDIVKMRAVAPWLTDTVHWDFVANRALRYKHVMMCVFLFNICIHNVEGVRWFIVEWPYDLMKEAVFDWSFRRYACYGFSDFLLRPFGTQWLWYERNLLLNDFARWNKVEMFDILVKTFGITRRTIVYPGKKKFIADLAGDAVHSESYEFAKYLVNELGYGCKEFGPHMQFLCMTANGKFGENWDNTGCKKARMLAEWLVEKCFLGINTPWTRADAFRTRGDWHELYERVKPRVREERQKRKRQ